MASADVSLYAVAVTVAAAFSLTPVASTDSLLNSYGEIRAAPTVAAVLALVTGGFVCFFGYRLLRPTLFFCGFAFCGLVAALVVEIAFSSFSWMPMASWVAFLLAGVGGGALSTFFYALGVLLVGALAGLLVAFLCQVSFAYAFIPGHPDVMLAVLVVLLGLIGGALTWKLEKPLLIIATSFIGATAMLWSVGYFAGGYPNAADMERFRGQSHGEWVFAVPGAWWAYLAATIMLFAMGVWVQWRRSGKGIRHRSVHDRSSRSRGRARESGGGYERAQTPLVPPQGHAERQPQPTSPSQSCRA